MEIHNIIKKVCERELDKKVIKIHDVKNKDFNINSVHIVETFYMRYVFKIYHSTDYPEKGKPVFVSSLLSKHSIPHARILSYSHGDDDFPTGYVLEECLPGITADRMGLSEAETCGIYEKLAALMSEIHGIKFTRHGFIIDGVPSNVTFTEHLEDNFIYGTSGIRGIYSKGELDKIKHTLIDRLGHCDMIQPCLCHIDVQLKNILVNRDSVILIDWDDARSFPAIVDVARLTLLIELAYDSEKAEEIERAEVYKNAFFNSYKLGGEITMYDDLEPALHAWHGLIILNFLAGNKPQTKKVTAVINRKLELLK
jgi:hypothetical protein